MSREVVSPRQRACVFNARSKIKKRTIQIPAHERTYPTKHLNPHIQQIVRYESIERMLHAVRVTIGRTAMTQHDRQCLRLIKALVDDILEGKE